ncbi:MAG: acetate kinase [Opitutaceae bacterium]|jgi:acetate kinase|nr:acetate kinase [Opitutaceae bacterium]
MRVLVANLGSTSFKYRLYAIDGIDGAEARMLARGGFERVTDYGAVIGQAMDELASAGHKTIDAVGFKTVLGGDITGCLLADEKVEQALLATADLAPAHNPPYAAGIRTFRERLPAVPRVALFETAFYQWVPPRAHRYAVPEAWYEAGIRRYGFHGASHKFVAERSAELLGRADIATAARNLYIAGPAASPESATQNPKPLRVISCHLGGSSSVTGIRDGVAIGTSMGLSPQSGLPQNNRVGDLDSGAIPCAMRRLGLSLADVEKQLTRESGLLGLSGVSNDVRDIKTAADKGDARARLALDAFVHGIRHWVGAFWLEMGGCDALVFTAGIGENNPWLRAAVCENLAELGLVPDPAKNAANATEQNLAAAGSRAQILVIPANEELVVARETARLITSLKK